MKLVITIEAVAQTDEDEMGEVADAIATLAYPGDLGKGNFTSNPQAREKARALLRRVLFSPVIAHAEEK